jgi:hypothetical protein
VRDRPWRELHRQTEEALTGLRERARDADKTAVQLPEGKDPQVIHHDAESLWAHIAAEGKPKVWLTKPPHVKRAKYLTTEATVNGAPCDTVDSLAHLIGWLETRDRIRRLWELWADKALPGTQALAIQVAELEELNEALGECVAVYSAVEAAMSVFEKVRGIAEPYWTDEPSRTSMLAAGERVMAERRLAQIQTEFDGWIHNLEVLAARTDSDREAIDQIRSRIESRDTTEYEILARKLADHGARRETYRSARALLDDIASLAPRCVDGLLKSLHEEHWDHRLKRLEKAVEYKQRETWIEEFLGQEDLAELERQMRRCEDDIAVLVEKEAAARAWGFAFGRMQEEHRRALTAWQQAVKALGKGTGKQAGRHRREAQKQLQKCRSATLADFRGLCSADMYPLQLDASRLSRDYAWWLLLSDHFTQYAEIASARARMPKVNRDQLLSYEFRLPPLAVQVEIANSLKSTMPLVARARDSMDKRLRAAESLPVSLRRGCFGDATPIDASPLVPAKPLRSGWRWRRLTEIARLATGHTPSRKVADYWDGDIPWLQLPDIRAVDGRYVRDTMHKTNQLGIDNSAAVLLPAGTVCLSRTASVGFVTIMGREMATSQDFVNWVCGPDLDPEFLMHLLIASRDYIRGLGSGAVHNTIYFPTVEQFSVCIPGIDEQRRIAEQLRDRLAAAERVIKHCDDELADVKVLPGALLRRAFGQG